MSETDHQPSIPTDRSGPPPPGAYRNPRHRRNRIACSILLGCALLLLVGGLGFGGCVLWGGCQLGRVITEEVTTREKLRRAHALLVEKADAADGRFPAAFDSGKVLGEGTGEYVYVAGLARRSPGKFILLYRRYTVLGTAQVMVISVAGTITVMSVRDFDELFAAQKKAMDAAEEGGENAAKALEEFETIHRRQEASRVPESSGSSSWDDWD